jgi:hypothetical protein
MKGFNRKILFSLLAAVAVLALFTCTVYGEQIAEQLGKQTETETKAGYVAKLADIDPDVVTKVYEAVGDWDKVTRNIFIYKKLLNMTAEDKSDQEELYALLPDYEAGDILVAYEYFSERELPIASIKGVLDEKTHGGDWQIILPKYGENKAHKRYRALTKEELKELLGDRYTPEDILKADNIASAKDLRLTEVLKLKTDEKSWDEIGKALRYKGDKTKSNFKLTVFGDTYGSDDKDVNALLETSKEKAQSRKDDQDKKVKVDFKLTDTEFENYQSQGFNSFEIENAFRLAKANNVKPEKIFEKKKQGLSWEEILAQYPNK